MCFADINLGADINITCLNEQDIVKALFAENSGVLIQVNNIAKADAILRELNIAYHKLGTAANSAELNILQNLLLFLIYGKLCSALLK